MFTKEPLGILKKKKFGSTKVYIKYSKDDNHPEIICDARDINYFLNINNG